MIGKIERNPYFINNWRHLFYPLFESVAFPVKLEFSHELKFIVGQKINEDIYLNDGVLSLLKLISTLALYRPIANKKFLISAKLAPLIPERYRDYFGFYHFLPRENVIKDASKKNAYTYIGLFENQYSFEGFRRSFDLINDQVQVLTIIHPMFDLENYRSTFKVERDLTRYLLEIEVIKKHYPHLLVELNSYDRFKESYRRYSSYIQPENSIFYYQYSSFDKIEILNGRNNSTPSHQIENSYYKTDKIKQHTDNFSEENLSYYGPCILNNDDLSCIENLYSSPLSIKNLDYFYYSEELINLAQEIFVKLSAFNQDHTK